MKWESNLVRASAEWIEAAIDARKGLLTLGDEEAIEKAWKSCPQAFVWEPMKATGGSSALRLALGGPRPESCEWLGAMVAEPLGDPREDEEKNKAIKAMLRNLKADLKVGGVFFCMGAAELGWSWVEEWMDDLLERGQRIEGQCERSAQWVARAQMKALERDWRKKGERYVRHPSGFTKWEERAAQWSVDPIEQMTMFHRLGGAPKMGEKVGALSAGWDRAISEALQNDQEPMREQWKAIRRLGREALLMALARKLDQDRPEDQSEAEKLFKGWMARLEGSELQAMREELDRKVTSPAARSKAIAMMEARALEIETPKAREAAKGMRM